MGGGADLQGLVICMAKRRLERAGVAVARHAALGPVVVVHLATGAPEAPPAEEAPPPAAEADPTAA